MRRLTFLLAAFTLGLFAGCCSSPSSRSVVTADYFRVVDLSTCARVVTQEPTTSYDLRFGRARIGAGDTAVRIAYQPVTLPARADTGVDPFHCARAGK